MVPYPLFRYPTTTTQKKSTSAPQAIRNKRGGVAGATASRQGRDGHQPATLPPPTPEWGVQGGEARPAWGRGARAPQIKRERPVRAFRERASLTIEWARGEL